MFGLLVSSFIWGTLADKIGRKLTVMLSILVISVGSLVGAFANGLPFYAFTRFVTGMGRLLNSH